MKSALFLFNLKLEVLNSSPATYDKYLCLFNFYESDDTQNLHWGMNLYDYRNRWEIL